MSCELEHDTPVIMPGKETDSSLSQKSSIGIPENHSDESEAMPISSSDAEPTAGDVKDPEAPPRKKRKKKQKVRAGKRTKTSILKTK